MPVRRLWFKAGKVHYHQIREIFLPQPPKSQKFPVMKISRSTVIAWLGRINYVMIIPLPFIKTRIDRIRAISRHTDKQLVLKMTLFFSFHFYFKIEGSYSPLLHSAKPTLMPKIKVKGQTVQTGKLGQTDTQTHKRKDRRRDGRYQVHYLPASLKLCGR